MLGKLHLKFSFLPAIHTQNLSSTVTECKGYFENKCLKMTKSNTKLDGILA